MRAALLLMLMTGRDELLAVGYIFHAIRVGVSDNDIHGPGSTYGPEQQADRCFGVAGGGNAVDMVQFRVLWVELNDDHLSMRVDHNKMVWMVGAIALSDKLIGLIGARGAILPIIGRIRPPVRNQGKDQPAADHH